MLSNRVAWIILDKHVVNELSCPSAGERIYYYADVLNCINVTCVFFWSDGSVFTQDNKYDKRKVGELQGSYENRRPDFALIYSWHSTSIVFGWLHNKKIPIINIADSDGHVGLKYSFNKYLRWRLRGQKNLFKKLGAFKHVLFQWLFDRNAECKRILHNVEMSKVLTFGSPGCSNIFKQFLDNENKKDLMDRVAWLPFPTSDIYYTSALVPKKKQIIIVHNWDSDTGINKKPSTVNTVIKRVADDFPNFKILIIGKGSGKLFQSSIDGFENIHLIEHLDKIELVEIMKESMIIFTASDYEGSPLVVNEFLGCGGTVVTGPLPSTVGFLGMNPESGTIAKKFDSRHLAVALRAEIELWEKGLRDPDNIAKYWRAHFSNKGIGDKIKDILARHIIS
jgi:glycosyltransferase involved in cell wall biosynthesis